MGLPSFIRHVLGRNRFPQQVGQELPDPVDKGTAPAIADQAVRDKALGRNPAKSKPKP